MAVRVCSLKFDADRDGGPQSVPAGGAYHVVRFPYGAAESYDADNMHPQTRNGTDHPFPSDPASGLIRPAHDAWGRLYAMIQWETAAGGAATEFRDQFVRDPLGTPDTTCTEHRPPSPGMQCFAKAWAIFVSPDVPLALRVAHDADRPLDLVIAEFKLEYDA
ncbi:hypothetical protein NE235_04285 [Actinoallomurus spadix]|uniref:Uncharacterized protein n=1 Tax=Actinoallomurus spadix TaxID=79912 RepID=A0ABP3FQ13_9ACTN|nr:hypothetical protein [Actinoallomurus spadix]MCO5985322.1 hypothetical protein [Actinoallomurus spadix]